jgi:hypothetical protein
MTSKCDRCKKPTEWADGVMIKDELWALISIEEGHLCEKCIEELLGRKLVTNDLKYQFGYKRIPINVEWAKRHQIEY